MVTGEMIRVTQGQVNGLSDILTGEMLKQEVTSESTAGYIHRPSLHATTLGSIRPHCLDEGGDAPILTVLNLCCRPQTGYPLLKTMEDISINLRSEALFVHSSGCAV
jgi:hypothetical protein